MRNDLFKWHPTKNHASQSDYLPFSNKKIWLICDKNHEWQTTFANYTKNIGCPYCSNHRVCSENNLESTYPKIAKEWHPNKNGDLTPKDVVYGSHKKIWWQCENQHEWISSIVKRTHSKRNCPFCSNQKVCSTNNLATNYPEIAEEWHPTKNNNLTPKDIVYGSCQKVWWICKCGFSWKATPRKRTANNTGCPICKASKGEKIICEYLKYEEIEFKTQHAFEKCRNKFKLPFDFYLPKYNICIEFQGEQHYKPIKIFGGMDKLKKIQKRDSIKKKFCEENQIKLITIPYWEKGCIKTILRQEIYD